MGYNNFKFKISKMMAERHPSGEKTDVYRQCAEDLQVNLSTVYRTVQLKKTDRTPAGVKKRGSGKVLNWFAKYFRCKVEDLEN